MRYPARLTMLGLVAGCSGECGAETAGFWGDGSMPGPADAPWPTSPDGAAPDAAVLPATCFASFVRTAVATGESSGSIAIDDFDADGAPDVVVGYGYGPGLFRVFPGNGDGTFSVPIDFGAPGAGYEVTPADMNHDGAVDIIVGGGGLLAAGLSIDPRVFLNDGAGAFTPAAGAVGPADGRHLATGDFDGDGDLDVALTQSTLPQRDSNSVIVFDNDGTGAMTRSFTVGGHIPHGIVAAFVDPDPHLDLLVTEVGIGFGGVSFIRGLGDGTFVSDGWNGIGDDDSVTPAAADFDGDGKVDVLLASYLSGTVTVGIGAGDGSFEVVTSVVDPLGPDTDNVVTGDFDGDARQDFAFTHHAPGTVIVMLGRGDGSFCDPLLFAAEGPTQLGLATGDLDGDGRLDIVATDEYAFDVYLNTTP